MSVTISQAGQPATIIITPGQGVAYAGTGAPGLGYASASVGPDGHLRLLRTDGVTVDAGKVAPTCARVVPVGTTAATGTVLVDEVTIALPNPQGGCCVLPGGINLARRVLNATGAVLTIWPGPGVTVDAGAAGAAVTILAGGSASFYSPDGLAWASA